MLASTKSTSLFVMLTLAPPRMSQLVPSALRVKSSDQSAPISAVSHRAGVREATCSGLEKKPAAVNRAATEKKESRRKACLKTWGALEQPTQKRQRTGRTPRRCREERTRLLSPQGFGVQPVLWRFCSAGLNRTRWLIGRGFHSCLTIA